MQIALIQFDIIEFKRDSENQFCEEHKFIQLFHTEDDTLSEEQFKGRIYDELLLKFKAEELAQFGIEKPEDIKLNLSIQL